MLFSQAFTVVVQIPTNIIGDIKKFYRPLRGLNTSSYHIEYEGLTAFISYLIQGIIMAAQRPKHILL